jgi:hypothetical protein
MMNTELRLDQVMKSIDVLGRLAFAGQCVAAMAIIAGPVLFVVASVLPFVVWEDNRGEALLIWLGGWLLAVAVTGAGVVLALFCWRWSGDWITEWPGYAVGMAFGAAADGALAYLLVATPVNVYLSFAATMAAAFVGGSLVAGHLGGARVIPEQRQRQRALARRR